MALITGHEDAVAQEITSTFGPLQLRACIVSSQKKSGAFSCTLLHKQMLQTIAAQCLVI
jgi:hypothetical protein